MVYNFVSGKIIVAEIYDNFAVKSRDWETRAPRWIASGLALMDISKGWEESVEEVSFTDYKFKLPNHVKALKGILVDDIPMENIVASPISSSDVERRSEYTYYINNGWAHLSEEEGVATIIYMKPPIEIDEESGLHYPLIPEVEEVKIALRWYVLMQILSRGYIHPIFSLNSNNGETNPTYKWNEHRRRAKYFADRMDNPQRHRMAKLLSEFLSNPNDTINYKRWTL
jgi:hypothetical protein